jgi:hypothetical protein
MRILEVITSPGTHLGQERSGRPFAAMGPVSPLRYLDSRRNLIWDGERRQARIGSCSFRPKNPRPDHRTPKGV